MSDNKVSVEMTIENQNVLKAWQQNNQETAKLRQELQQLVAKSKEGERASEAHAKQVAELTWKLDKAKQKQKELNEEVKEGAKAARQVEKYAKEVGELEGQLVEARAAQERLLEESKDWQRAALLGDRYKKQIVELKSRLREAEDAQKQAAASTKGWGQGFLDGLIGATKYSNKIKDLERQIEDVEDSHKAAIAEAKAWNRAEPPADEYLRKIRELRRELKSTKDEQRAAAEGVGGQLRTYAMGFAGVGAAISGVHTAARMIREEYESWKRRQEEAAGTQATAGEALREARKAFQPDATLGADALESSLEALRGKHNSSTQIVAGVAAEALSAKGALDNRSALSAVDAALAVAPRDAGQATTLASRYLDLMNAGGISDARQVGGFIGQVQANSRVKNMTMLGSNLVPAINSLMAQGNTMEQAGELTSTLNNLMSDAEGAVTKTAVISLGNKLANFVSDGTGKDAFGEFRVPQAQRDAYEAARSQGTQAQIRAMQENPELRRAFFASNTFEAEANAPIKAWLSGERNARAQFDAVRSGIAPVDGRLAGEFDRQVAFFNSGSFQPIVEAGERGAANLEQKQLRDRLGGLTGKAREEYNRALEAVNLPGFAPITRRSSLGIFDAAAGLGKNPAREAEAQLRHLADGTQLKNGRRENLLSDDDRDYARTSAELMGRIADSIDEMTREIKAQTRESQRPAAQTPRTNRPSGRRGAR